jgi:hypothetical protein
MHLENLAPLIALLPLVALLLLALGGFLLFDGGRRRRQVRRADDRERRYWMAELAYRARLRAKDWVTRTKTPRLTYQGPPLSEQPQEKAKRRK